MASEGEKTIFDVEAASTLVNELKSAYAAGKSRSYEWRISQVQCILKMVEHHEQDILDAVFSDLSKPAFEVSFYEVLSLSLSLSLSHLCLFSCMVFAYIYIYI
jgi:aldehyde dehydrogenase (NAD+)